jgi:uncharacterized protein YabE (DUF348 family)
MNKKIKQNKISHNKMASFIKKLEIELLAGVFIMLAVLSVFIKPVFASSAREVGFRLFSAGKEYKLYSEEPTLGEALDNLGFSLQEGDTLEPDASTKLEDGLRVNLYKARLVYVYEDGNLIKRAPSSKQTAELVAKQLDLKIDPEDEVVLESSRKSAKELIPSIDLKIKRAKVVKLDLFGIKSEFKTRAENIEEFLVEKNIVLSEGDKVLESDNLKSNLDTVGYQVTVQNQSKEVIEDVQTIKYGTETIKDVTKDTSYKIINQAGEDGSKKLVIEIQKINGVEVSRVVISEQVTKEPVKQVVTVGAKVVVAAAPVSGGHEDWMRAAGITESDFGYVNYIITRESTWNYLAVNRSSGAYGLCQSLPGSKMLSAGSDWQTNPITQLRWCNGYALGRYGSWAKAYNFWVNNHWW